MGGANADQAVNDFIAGRLTRRQLVSRLMALGAAAVGVGGVGREALAGGGAQEGEPTFKTLSVDHIALNVTDIPRSRDWYVKHLGLRVTRESASNCFMDCGSDFVALFKSERPGLNHFSFAIPDYDQREAAQRLRDVGLTPKPRGGRLYFDDPDGIEVQVSPG